MTGDIMQGKKATNFLHNKEFNQIIYLSVQRALQQI